MDYKKAKELAVKRVKAKKGFFMHFGIYLTIGLFFLGMNILTFSPEDGWWFMFPLLPWGVGLSIHYLSVFGFPGIGIMSSEWEQRQIEKETRRILYSQGSDLTDDDLEEMELKEFELKELEKSRQRRWNEDDFI